MDVNVFGDITDPCLFKWSELSAPGLLPDSPPLETSTGAGAGAPSSSSSHGPALDALLDLEQDDEEDDEDEGPARTVAAESGTAQAPTAAQWPPARLSPVLEFRVVEEEPRVAPTSRLLHGLPRDLLDAGAGEGSLAHAIAAMQAQQGGGEDSAGEEA